jgi:hypothetical protein
MMGGVDYDKAIADLLKAKQIAVSAKKGKTMLTLKHEGKLALVEDNVVAMAGKK